MVTVYCMLCMGPSPQDLIICYCMSCISSIVVMVYSHHPTSINTSSMPCIAYLDSRIRVVNYVLKVVDVLTVVLVPKVSLFRDKGYV